MKVAISVSYVTLALSTLVNAEAVQNPILILPPTALGHRETVRKLFLDSYAAYKEFAFGHDDLSPLSKSFSDGRNGWGATIVDAMTTAIVMGETAIVNEALNFSSHIDFSMSQTPDTVSVFETTIRYLGGLLSAYDLTGRIHQPLITKAKEVADKMAFAWASPTQDVPYGFLNFTTNTPTIATSNIAEAGTLTIEWSTLSRFTGNDTYRNLTEKSVRHIGNLAAPLPGLPAQGIDPTSGQFVGGYVSWGGGSDSFFEYLIKYARLTNTDDNFFADLWHTAVDSSITTLLRESTVGGHQYLADFDDQRLIRHVGSHLACFLGGNWLLGGRLMNNQTIVNVALELIDGCWNTYTSTITGIGPEAFAFISSDGNFTGSTVPAVGSADDMFYNEHGFYITSSDYIMRPEVLESNFYAWRVTGNTKYLDRAAAALASFLKWLPSTVGYGEINDVNSENPPKIDDTQSFWFAETLKYLYLTFDDPSHISLNDWVFNTECHPVRAPPAKPVYGSGKLLKSTSTFQLKTGAPLPAISPAPFVKIPVPPQQ